MWRSLSDESWRRDVCSALQNLLTRDAMKNEIDQNLNGCITDGAKSITKTVNELAETDGFGAQRLSLELLKDAKVWWYATQQLLA